MPTNQELAKIQTKIGNSFIRAFFPIDYRSNQNILKNIDDMLEREVKGLRALSSTTSLTTQKMTRALSSMSDELDKIQDSLDSLHNKMKAGDELLGQGSQSAENASNALLDFLVAGGFEGLRALKNRRAGAGGKGNSRAAAEKEAARRAKIDKWRNQKTGKPAEAPKASGKYKLPKGMTVIALGMALWDMWSELQALDPNMKKGEYRQAVAQIIARAVASFGLTWVGAFLGAAVGSAFFGVGAIPGFIFGLLGGAAADYMLGDTVDELVNKVVDYLYTGEEEEAPEEAATSDATVQMREPPAPTPALEPAQQQVSEQAAAQVPLAPPISGPQPPTPPAEQMVDSPVQYPGPVSAADLQPFAPPTNDARNANNAVNEALKKAETTIPQTEADQTSLMQGLYGPSATNTNPAAPFDNTAQFDVNQGMSAGQGMGQISTSSGMSTMVAAQLVPNFQGFISALEATGYQIKSLGGYADRNIAGSSKKSFHASGAAIDINPGENPHLKNGGVQTDMPSNVGAIAKHFGLGWGGNWKSSKDTMHFSAASSEGGDFKVDRNTGAITPLAAGAKVHAKKGGTLALIAEAGEPEYVVPQSKAIKFAHEMIAARPQTRTKKYTHVMVVPILT